MFVVLTLTSFCGKRITTSSKEMNANYLSRLDTFINGAHQISVSNSKNKSLASVLDSCSNKLKKCNVNCSLDESDIEKLKDLQLAIDKVLLNAPKAVAVDNKPKSNPQRPNDNNKFDPRFNNNASSDLRRDAFGGSNNSMASNSSRPGGNRNYQNSGNNLRRDDFHNSNNSIASNSSRPQNNRRLNNNQKSNVPTTVVCPCCFTSLGNIKDLFYHIEDTCEVMKSGSFVEPTAFSVYQIVTNGIKCNLCNIEVENFAEQQRHERDFAHIDQTKRGKGLNSDSRFMFCAACREAVPSSGIQYDHHVTSETHNELSVPRRDLLNKSIGYQLYAKDIKCLHCTRTVKVGELSNHMVEKRHLANLAKNASSEYIWCSFCEVEILLASMLLHVGQKSHEQKSMKKNVCLFCVNITPDILNHWKSQCSAVQDLRQRRKNITQESNQPNRPTKRVTESIEPQQGQKPPITRPKPTITRPKPTGYTNHQIPDDCTTVLIKGMENIKITKLEVMWGIQREYADYLKKDLEVIDNDTFRVTFESAEGARILLSRQKVCDETVTVVPDPSAISNSRPT